VRKSIDDVIRSFAQGEGYRRRRSSGGERARFREAEIEPRK
jgi:hypothetical protein